MAIYGLLILGPSQHMWFNLLSKVFPNRDVSTTLKKIFMGQAVFGPAINTVFFSYNGALQGNFFSAIPWVYLIVHALVAPAVQPLMDSM